MKVKELKEVLNKCNDNDDVFISNSHNTVGNISELAQVEESNYQVFGESTECILLNSTNSEKVLYLSDDVEVSKHINTR